MKNLIVLMTLILASCGGVGTEQRTGENAVDNTGLEAGQLEQDLSKNVGCTDEVETSISAIAQLCAANMNVDVNKSLCLLQAKSLVSDHPNFVCSLESGQLVDADYIQKNFISANE